MSPDGIAAVAAIVIALGTHALALFRWASRLEVIVRDHEKRISHLEEA